MSTISVIIPVYNVEAYLKRCVDSVLSQTFQDFDLVLVDDGSPDSCGVICDEYAQNDKRVTVIHQKNGGLSVARNTGIEWSLKNSSSSWISFVDSDDWVHSKYLEILYNAAIKTNCPVSMCEYVCTEGDNTSINDNLLKPQIRNTIEMYCKKNVVFTVAWAKLYKKECFRYIRYPAGRIHEDEFITYKILFEYKKAAYIEQPLYMYFQNPNGIMLSEWAPRHLDKLDALRERIIYLDKKELVEAKEWTVIMYLSVLRSYGNIMGRDEKYSKELKKMYSMNRVYLIKHPLKLPCWKYKELYIFSFPVLYICYSRIIPFVRGFKGYLKKE